MTTELPRTPGAEPTRPVVVPRVLGDYELDRRVGEGGMGVVWRARSQDGREVAVKVLREHIAHDEHARARLRREVHTLARVHHPRVAAVIDADVDGPAPHVVTEFVPGDPLDRVVAEQGPLRGDALLRLGRGLGEALHAIHAAGIVHRDLKPGNVLMVQSGDGALDPVVIDFGIAQVADDVRLTATGMVMGTPGYLSPELVESGEVSEATDWWGWAATLAFAASGEPPFGRGPLTVVLDRVVRGRLRLEGVDPRLRPLLAAALDPDPARRPDERQVLDGLERYARGQDVTRALPAWVREEQRAASVADPTSVQREGPRTRVAPSRPGRVVPVRDARSRGAVPPGGAPGQVAHGAGAWPAVQGGAVHDPAYADPAYRGPAYPDPVAPPAPGERGGADPRIGRSSRTGTLVALLVALVGGATVAPLLAWGLFGLWSVAVRTVDGSLTGMVLRRHHAGRRRSDVPVLVLTSPWHLVSGVLVTLFALVLPLGVGALVALVFAGFVSSTGTMVGIGLDHPLAVGLGSLVGAALAWWGLGSVSLRRGSRTVLRGILPRGPLTLVLVTLCVVGGGALAVWSVLVGGPVSWWPLGPDFDPRSLLPFQL
ncbi:serine/threonine-protein kinase [Ornithinimicrobium avium]|uniref:serine/threonine-protein kinase n=1 Tax=Ornithinimicrobium avium TaxID=2283195 RepID=UPI0013B35DCD|nr:serine/threonine-protein kinase [Ornithinimicrobium avium]